MVGSSYILYHSLEFTQVYPTLLYHPAHSFTVLFPEFIVVSIIVPKLVWSLEPAFGAQISEEGLRAVQLQRSLEFLAPASLHLLAQLLNYPFEVVDDVALLFIDCRGTRSCLFDWSHRVEATVAIVIFFCVCLAVAEKVTRIAILNIPHRVHDELCVIRNEEFRALFPGAKMCEQESHGLLLGHVANVPPRDPLAPPQFRFFNRAPLKNKHLPVGDGVGQVPLFVQVLADIVVAVKALGLALWHHTEEECEPEEDEDARQYSGDHERVGARLENLGARVCCDGDDYENAAADGVEGAC